jgi:hypothetical protein
VKKTTGSSGESELATHFALEGFASHFRLLDSIVEVCILVFDSFVPTYSVAAATLTVYPNGSRSFVFNFQKSRNHRSIEWFNL